MFEFNFIYPNKYETYCGKAEKTNLHRTICEKGRFKSNQIRPIFQAEKSAIGGELQIKITHYLMIEYAIHTAYNR